MTVIQSVSDAIYFVNVTQRVKELATSALVKMYGSSVKIDYAVKYNVPKEFNGIQGMISLNVVCAKHGLAFDVVWLPEEEPAREMTCHKNVLFRVPIFHDEVFTMDVEQLCTRAILVLKRASQGKF